MTEKEQRQRDVVLELLKERGSLTQKDVDPYGISRLSAVICQIKKRGIDIRTTNEKVKTRYGTTVIARYSLCPD